MFGCMIQARILYLVNQITPIAVDHHLFKSQPERMLPNGLMRHKHRLTPAPGRKFVGKTPRQGVEVAAGADHPEERRVRSLHALQAPHQFGRRSVGQPGRFVRRDDLDRRCFPAQFVEPVGPAVGTVEYQYPQRGFASRGFVLRGFASLLSGRGMAPERSHQVPGIVRRLSRSIHGGMLAEAIAKSLDAGRTDQPCPGAGGPGNFPSGHLRCYQSHRGGARKNDRIEVGESGQRRVERLRRGGQADQGPALDMQADRRQIAKQRFATFGCLGQDNGGGHQQASAGCSSISLQQHCRHPLAERPGLRRRRDSVLQAGAADIAGVVGKQRIDA